MKKLSFAIVGGGPAAFYISKCLAKLPQQPLIHIFQKQYCPFGLIRYGVAPDHISIKKSQTTLSTIASYTGFQYYGNQEVTEQTLSELRKQYSGVVYAIGAQQNNEPSWFTKWKQASTHDKTVLNARDVVYWYNNHPRYETYQLDLSNKRDVVIIGNGNVAIDICRILLKDPAELTHTEISENALKALVNSKIRNVTMVGRRGFTHSAFALKQLRELTHHKIKIYCIEEQMEASMNESSYIECTSISNTNATVVRMNKRKVDFLKEKAHIIKKAQLAALMQNDQRKLIIRYLLDPIEIDSANCLRLSVTHLKGEPFKQTVERTEKEQRISFDLLVNSTGFKVKSIVADELDKARNRIWNSNGCVLVNQDRSKVMLGQYSVGWCKNGPRGVIDQTLLSSEETFNNIRIHVNNRAIQQKQVPVFSTPSNINFSRYLQLKEEELQRGDKEKYIKKKLSIQEIKQFFGQS